MIKEVKLLNHQYEVLADTETKIIGMVSGFGGGKTYTMCRKAIQLAILNKGFTGIATEPTHDMLRNIFIPEMISALEEWGIKYKLNKAISTFLLYIDGIETKIICMSMENYERLVGINASWAVMDEVDTSKGDIAEKAYNKILGRIRTGNIRQLCIFSTPEGFSFLYKCFVKEIDKGSKRLIKARTLDNKYLPQDFIDTLKSQYPPNLLQAYLNGEFVNLNSGTIYSYFNRETHHSNEDYQDKETIYVSQDFNYLGCISIVYVKRNGFDVAIDEIISNDTKSIIENIKYRYPNSYVCIYPDASGNAHKTSSNTTDIEMLRQAGFSVFVNSRNPSVRDRINITNNLFDKQKVKVNVYKCPKFTEALEQHSYDEKTGEPCKYSGGATVDDFTDGGTYYLAYEYPIIASHKVHKLTGI